MDNHRKQKLDLLTLNHLQLSQPSSYFDQANSNDSFVIGRQKLSINLLQYKNILNRMRLSQLGTKLKCLIKRYLMKNGRINAQLEQIVTFIKANSLSTQLISILTRTFTSSEVFKILILLNKLAHQRVIDQKNMHTILSKMTTKIHGDFQAALNSKMIAPYRFYLQKRVTIDFYDTSSNQSQAKVYQLLNLINLGTSFTEMIYTIGRYYMREYLHVIDFNIVLAADIKFLYTEMTDLIKRPAAESILLEIEQIHEKMYVLFYNCYFHRYIKGNIPRWILTDYKNKYTNIEKTAEKKQITKGEFGMIYDKNCSTAATKRGSALNGSMEQSSVFLIDNNIDKHSNDIQNSEIQISSFLQDQKERINLLHSLERIVFSFSI